jgi:hypothetical protein
MSAIRAFLGCLILPIDIDIIAIVLMEIFGAIFFLLAFTFTKHSRRVSSKMKALQEALAKATMMTAKREEGPCYSYKWVISHTMGPRRIFSPSGFLPLLVMALSGVIAATLLIVFHSAGYSLILALIGAAVILETDVFEARAYSATIQKVALDQLDEEDLSYMEIVTGALKIGAIRFIVAGAIFAVAGPFIPLIFDGLCYALVLYMSIVFKATEAAQNASRVLALVIAMTLPATLLYLPQLVGRTILFRTKVAIRKMRKHREK